MRTLLIAAVALLPVVAQVTPEEIASEIKTAKEARLRGDLTATVESLHRALALSSQLHGEMSIETAAVLSDLAAAQRALMQSDAAIESLNRAVNIRARARTSDPIAQARDLTALAFLYADANRSAEVKPCLVQALEEWTKAGRDGPETLITLEALAGIYRSDAEYAEAEPLYVRALRIREFAYGTESSELLGTLDSLAYVYFGMKRYADAEPLYNRLLRIWEKSAGPEHPMFALTLEKMAEFLATQQRYDEASPLVERAAVIRGRSHISSMHFSTRLALMQARMPEAVAMVTKTIATAETAGLPDDAFVEPMRVQAAILKDAGRNAEAQAYEARVKAVIFKGEARPLPPKKAPAAKAKAR